MTLSEYSIKHLAKAICGDSGYTPYLTGPVLVEFFNKYGIQHIYGEGFPSRWKFSEDKVRELNGTDLLRQLIEETVDPRRFLATKFKVEKAVDEINQFLKFDHYELRIAGDFYKIVGKEGRMIYPESSKQIDHKFINEQIEKCHRKIVENDFNGAITNARSLLEAVFIEIIERKNGSEVKNDGNIDNMWSQVKKIMKLEIDKTTLPDYVIQILSGLDTAIKGLAALSNNAGDRHATKFITRKHHAKLSVNLAMTISDFLIDSWQFKVTVKE